MISSNLIDDWSLAVVTRRVAQGGLIGDACDTLRIGGKQPSP